MRDFQRPGRSSVFSTQGMCATSHPLAANVAVRLLEQGGNAMDAAIAAAMILGLCEPGMTGLGGDCFALVKPAGTDQIVALNGSGRAPTGLNAELLREQDQQAIGLGSVHAVTVPGLVDAVCKLSHDYGLLGLDKVLQPAIHYARQGVPVGPRTAFDWQLYQARLQGRARDFYLREGQAFQAGDVFCAPQLARVLERITQQGRAGFYEGEVAEDMVDSLRALGGQHTLEDFANTHCQYTTPISGLYRGVELLEHPPNGQGIVALLINNILQPFDVAALEPFGVERTHLEAEASKLAYDARDRFLADPDQMNALDYMMTEETATKLAALISPDKAIQQVSETTAAVHKDTVYLTVVDRDLMAVSMICSVFHAFGSGLASQRFGINFQNRGAAFSLQAGHPNELQGGKRPVHTIIPAMLKQDGRVIMPFGVMGGLYQANGHARFMSNILDFGMHPQAAIDAPRSFPQDGQLRLESGYEDSVLQGLAALGHDVIRAAEPIGGAQAIHIDYERGVLEGASDPRKDGCALGY